MSTPDDKHVCAATEGDTVATEFLSRFEDDIVDEDGEKMKLFHFVDPVSMFEACEGVRDPATRQLIKSLEDQILFLMGLVEDLYLKMGFSSAPPAIRHAKPE
jgi:hypothetical protein